MLCSLAVRNYAILSSVEMEFAPGLTVLTGETGAGKSILIGALSLALGERSLPEAVRRGADAASVEGIFRFPPRHPTLAQIEKQGIPLSGEDVLVRREVTVTGRSKAYLNDTAITLAALKRFGDAACDLHGQHEHQSLLDEKRHLDYLDGFGSLVPLREEFAGRFQDHLRLEQELSSLQAAEALTAERKELYAFQIRELEDARLAPAEEEALLIERRVLENAERLIVSAGQVIEELSEGENAVLSRVEAARKVLEESVGLDPRLKEAAEGLATLSYQAEDVVANLRGYRAKLEFDPERLDEIHSRLDTIWRMKKKYGGSVESARKELERLKAELASQESRGEAIGKLEDSLARNLKVLREEAGTLSAKRRKTAGELTRRVKKELAGLGLEKAAFEVRLRHEPSPDGQLVLNGLKVRVTETGADQARFFFNANPGEEAWPLDRVASGGEISRVMLALKTVLAEVDEVPTLIFDEIDAGIGGKVAEDVGRKLAAIARKRQVLCITHLPQIAAQAEEHFLVEKREESQRTYVSIRKLSRTERVQELARMMAGQEVTDLARAHAREMLKQKAGP